MKEYSRKLLAKAVDSIEAAQALLEIGKSDISAGRAYYAMFYIAEALLAEKGLKFSKHTGVHTAFGEQFAKTNLMDARYHRWLIDGFDKRLVGDYGVDAVIEKDVASEMINQAQEFLKAARVYLEM
jgi:uncharacterized protein (UPF0332 family)